MLSLLSAILLSIVIVIPDGTAAQAPQAGPVPEVAVAPPSVVQGSPDIEAAGPYGALKGTLVTPEAPSPPVVLILPDSGPTDREGNTAHGAKVQTYKLLAEGLVQQGIASIRIDKRGMFGSAAAYPRVNDVTMVDYARDVLAWVEVARQRTGAPCVWLLGHGEGGLVALLAAQRGQNICGLALVATPGRPVGEVTTERLRTSGADGYLVEEALAVLGTLSAGRAVDPRSVSPPVLSLLPPDTHKFMISLLALKPSVLVSNVRQPVLILQGERDIQIGVADAQQLKAAKPDAALAVLPNTNHVLKAVGSDDRGVNAAAYQDARAPLAPGVADTIAQFISAAR